MTRDELMALKAAKLREIRDSVRRDPVIAVHASVGLPSPTEEDIDAFWDTFGPVYAFPAGAKLPPGFIK